MYNIYKNYLKTHPFYSPQHLDASGSFRFFDKNYLEYLPRDKKARILDIGCGTGHFLSYVIVKGYTEYLGVDISEDQVAHCKKYVTKKVMLITTLQKFLKDKKNYYDFILMNDVIEHLEKEEVIHDLSLINHSLKKNGTVIIRTVNLKNRWGMAVRYMDFTHTVGITHESLLQVLRASGFSIITLANEIHPIHDMKSLIRVSLKNFFECIYRLEYLASFGDFHSLLSNMLIAIGKKS